jgi:asparagine synthase (glutamine-hydrolysing)
MCGIVGIYAYRDSAAPVDRAELVRIREAMARRGPDGAGMWVSADGRVGLAHRRLAIIDLSPSGAQPMASADGLLTITFNGEIYNYRELRRELERRGFVFRTHSDTEVLLHLYADRGREMVHCLRGMFAFGIWDERAHELFLARDPLGIKPLYYADDGSTFRFATLTDALLEGGGVDDAIDDAALAGFYLFGCVPDPLTFRRAVRAVPAGTTMRVGRNGKKGPVPYFSITDELAKAEAAPSERSPADMVEEIRAALSDSMRYHMVSDVPVGIFLSSGVDSSVLAALGAELNREKLHAITLGFEEYRGTSDDETVFATRIAEGLGLGHSTRWIERKDFHREWRSFFASMDQASTDGINSYFVAKAAADCKLKVAISGLGGDELFGGYPSFRDVPLMRRLLPRLPAVGRFVRRLSYPLLRRITSPKYAGVLEYGPSYAGAYLLRRALYMPWELPELMGRERADAALAELRPLERLRETIGGLTNERSIVAGLELSWYMRNQLLRDSDWAGMYHGVEVRVPFADVAVLRSIAPLLASRAPPTKAMLANAIVHPLTANVATRAKTGFSVPVRDWLREAVPDASRERGLRGWSRVVGRQKRGPRFMSFVTDAYGCHGGIALYNRDLLQALCSYPRCSEVVAIPRRMPNPPEAMPGKLAYRDGAVGDKRHYLAAALRILRGDRGHDLVVCGHINLLPLAWLASRILRVPMILFIYGIDAWRPTRSVLANALAKRVRWVVSISEVTAGKFRAWSRVNGEHLRILPNAIHAEWYGPGKKNAALLERYGLAGKKVLMTLGRLVSAERYKGFDETLEAMPKLASTMPDLVYLIVGDGSDRGRLERKARALGVAERVIFAGNVPEPEKADHYRLADVYVMPSQGEGFGFVLLEAMACGIPVIASKRDGGREALREGRLGLLVDPSDPRQLELAIPEALRQPKGIVPSELEHFSFRNFEARAHALLGEVLAESSQPFHAA